MIRYDYNVRSKSQLSRPHEVTNEMLTKKIKP